MQDKSNIEYWLEKENLEWYTRQFDNPYRITVAFEKFLTENVNMNGLSILDIGCGPGGYCIYCRKAYDQ